MINFVITVDFKEFSTGKVFVTIFGSITINLLHSLNITFTVSINKELIPESAIFQMLCVFLNFNMCEVYWFLLHNSLFAK